MNILIWLIMGGIIGWLASVIMRTQEGLLMNIVVGIVGALLGGWLISPLVGAGTINQGDLSLAGLGGVAARSDHPVGHREPVQGSDPAVT
jgi:uncharacterized membrane protein YeaQ/YmgE (transglycosylase-associated protein family)